MIALTNMLIVFAYAVVLVVIVASIGLIMLCGFGGYLYLLRSMITGGR
jgi:hypothetical protein